MQLTTNVAQIVAFEVAIANLMKVNHYRQHLAQTHLTSSLPLVLTMPQQQLVKGRFKSLAKIVDVTEQFE